MKAALKEAKRTELDTKDCVYSVVVTSEGGVAEFQALSISGGMPCDREIAAHMLAAAKELLDGA